MGSKYRYEIRNMSDTSKVLTETSMRSVERLTGLSTFLIYQCIDRHKHVNGWIIERKLVEKPVAEKREIKPRGVIVFFPDGRTQYFGTQRECAIAMGISESTVLNRIKDGNVDSKGNGYDYPA